MVGQEFLIKRPPKRYVIKGSVFLCSSSCERWILSSFLRSVHHPGKIQWDRDQDEDRLKPAGRDMKHLYVILFTCESLKFPQIKGKKIKFKWKKGHSS